MKTILIIAVAVVAIGSTLALHVTSAQQAGTKRADLQRHDLSAPGREVIQVRVDFDPGYVAPMHIHPGEEIIYVIEGTLEYEIGGKKSKVKAGDVLFVPAGTPHTATNIGSDNGRSSPHISSKRESRSSLWLSEPLVRENIKIRRQGHNRI